MKKALISILINISAKSETSGISLFLDSIGYTTPKKFINAIKPVDLFNTLSLTT